ncbi:MAG: ATP-binding protein [Gammaproteobacteria bacterium]|nr:ATP-binding protein [Gammaproteobacteria bacterium]
MFDLLPFKRTHLAKAYCDSLVGKGITNATSGLFLAGPRRVGKSTFLIEDLIPEANNRSWLSVYVDLWSNKQIDPALLITEAIKTTITCQKGRFSQWAAKARLHKVSILKTVELDFSKPGLPENITLSDLLNHLINLAGKPVLLVIDEAQHALTSEAGINAMFSIKSARDQINMSHGKPYLMLVLTGSNRDKLAQLVVKKDQPFFGSEISAFPLLGRDYTDFFTEKVNVALASHNQFSAESVWEAFQLVGHRPEMLRQIIGRVALSDEAESLSELLKRDASLWHDHVWEEFENDFNALSPLQKAILAVLIEQGRQWSPFSEESMERYKKLIQRASLSIPTVQSAIQSLRDLGFIWQSGRGSYALEDESFGEWFKHQH